MNKLWIFLAFFVLTGCGSLKMYKSPNEKLLPNSSITIYIEQKDKIGISNKIEGALLSIGYNIISPDVAKSSLKYNSSITEQQSKSSAEAELYKTQEFKSQYLMKVNYHAYYDLIYWSFTSFNATITDLKSGKIVMSASYSGKGKTVDSVIEELRKQLSNNQS